MTATADNAVVSDKKKRSVVAWCFFDWANSPFPAVVTTFVFATYYVSAIAPDKITGAAQWSFMQAIAAIVVALLGPVLGAIADNGRRRKPWLAVCTAVLIAGTAALWFAVPHVSSTWLLLITVAIATVGFEIGMVFYNAMLLGLVSDSYLGRVSGWAWSLGYFGGLACLILLLVLFMLPGAPDLGMDKSAAAQEHIRIAGPVVALWMFLFSLPLFLFVPDSRGKGLPVRRAIGAGLRQLRETVVELRRYRNVLRFLIARLFYYDGINTIFIVGAIYAAAVFGMKTLEIFYFGILLNITAGIGAFGFAWMDDKVGAKPTIMVSVVGVIAVGIPLLLIESKLWFYILGSGIGLFFGPVQAASRSMMVRLSPPGKETEMFGLFAFSGRATVFLGPWLFGMITLAAGPRWGMAVTMPMLVIGLFILMTVKVPGRADTERVED